MTWGGGQPPRTNQGQPFLGPPRFVLCRAGPAGAGKRTALRALAASRGTPVFTVPAWKVAAELQQEDVTQSRTLRDAVERAAALQPSIVLVEDLTAFAAVDGAAENEQALRAVAQLASGVGGAGDIIVTATASSTVALPRLLIQAFGRELCLEPPQLVARLGILRSMWGLPDAEERAQPASSDAPSTGAAHTGEAVIAATVAKATAGFLPGDLLRLCRTAWAAAAMQTDSASGPGRSTASKLSWELHWRPALDRVKPSALAPFETGVEAVCWEQVAGYEEAASRLQSLLATFESSVAAGLQDGVQPPSGVCCGAGVGCCVSCFVVVVVVVFLRLWVAASASAASAS